jgi:hypothetical protein
VRGTERDVGKENERQREVKRETDTGSLKERERKFVRERGESI